MARIVKWEVAGGDRRRRKTLTLPGLMTIARDVDQADPDDLGLKLSEGKAILEQIQAQIASIRSIK